MRHQSLCTDLQSLDFWSNFWRSVQLFPRCFFVVKNEKKGRTTMIQNETKSPEILKAERQVEQAKARLAEAKRKESAKKRSDENKHKYMMGGIVHKYFPECYGFDEHELNRILAAAIKSEQCQRMHQKNMKTLVYYGIQ